MQMSAITQQDGGIGVIAYNDSNLGDAAGSNEDILVFMYVNSGGKWHIEERGVAGAATTISASTADEIWWAKNADTAKVWIGIWDDNASTMYWVDNDGSLDGDPAAGTNDSGPTNVTAANINQIGPAGSSRDSVELTILRSDEVSGTVPTGFTYLDGTDNITRNQSGKLADHFATVLYTGDAVAIGSGGNPITGVGFQPDYVWLKSRTSVRGPAMYDAVRGATKRLLTHVDHAEATTAEGLTSFDSDGFTVGSSAEENESGKNFVAWCIKAASTASGATTGAGTAKTYTTQYNPDLGFAIVKYTGNLTAGHTIPLPAMTDPKAPFMIIYKDLPTTLNWYVWHQDLTPDYALKLQTTNAQFAASPVWDNASNVYTAPTSASFTVGGNANTNTNDAAHIAYVFWETDFCKPVTYAGNASTDGSFLNLGGAPAWIMAKRRDGATDWWMTDNVMNPTNPTQYWIKSNASEAQQTGVNPYSDFVSNGYKHRATHSTANGSGSNYIGIAFVSPEPDSKDGAQLRAR
jgi:hypothetical protein